MSDSSLPLPSPKMLAWVLVRRGWDMCAESPHTWKFYKADMQETVITLSKHGEVVLRRAFEDILSNADILDNDYIALHDEYVKVNAA